MLKSLKYLYSQLLNFIFPSTTLENYIEKLVSGHALLPTAQIQLVGNGISCFSYRDKIIRDLMWQLKYKGDTRIAKIFGQELQKHILTYLKNTTLTGPYTVTAIPLSRRRFWWRGYNQSELIAKEICKENSNLFIHNSNILNRTIHKTAQAKIKNPSERLLNAQNIFSIKNNLDVKDKTIILIDDVITTGATLRSATNTLKKAEAHHVVWLAVAH